MAKQKILVVDDSPTQLIMYKMALVKEGYEIVTANNGVEAINSVYADTFDLIISDILMPEINGYVFCRLLKYDPLKAHIPVILLTGLGQQHDRFWGIEAGASSFIVKDTNTSNLISEVKKLLRAHITPSFPLQGVNQYNLQSETNSDIRTKIFEILDRLLFDSSVSNKIREIVRYAYDVNQLKSNLFRLLSNLMEYSVAAIAFKMDKNSIISFEITDKVSQEHLKDVMKRTLKGEKVENYKLNILGKEKISETETNTLKSEMIVPLIDKEKWGGFIGIYSYNENQFEDDDYKILNIFARELVLILQFITKMAEIDDFRSEFTANIIEDINKPLEDSINLLGNLKNDLKDEHSLAIIEQITSNLIRSKDVSLDMTKNIQKMKSDIV